MVSRNTGAIGAEEREDGRVLKEFVRYFVYFVDSSYISKKGIVE